LGDTLAQETRTLFTLLSITPFLLGMLETVDYAFSHPKHRRTGADKLITTNNIRSPCPLPFADAQEIRRCRVAEVDLISGSAPLSGGEKNFVFALPVDTDTISICTRREFIVWTGRCKPPKHAHPAGWSMTR